MTASVINASIAVKWVVDEEGTEEVLALRLGHKLMAPELLIAECANILWKKVRRFSRRACASPLRLPKKTTAHS